MLLTCERAECGIEFRARQVRRFCGVARSGLAHRAASRHCACGKLLVRYQRVACSSQCAGRIRGGNGAALHTSDTREAVRVLWDQVPQLSARQIGAQMRPMMTKNAVIGMAHRGHFPSRPSPIGNPAYVASRPHIRRAPRVTLPVLVAAARKPPEPPAKPPRRAPEPPAVPPVSAPRPRAPWPVADDGGRRDGCQWISGSGRPWTKCGAPVSGPGSAWCPAHRRRVYGHAYPPLRSDAGAVA